MKPTSTRKLSEMKGVLFDNKIKEPEKEIYEVYREVDKKGDLRYDVTIIPPNIIGKEFVRTKGNRNSKNYPELYTVLEGSGIFLMQKTDKNNVLDVYAVKINAGEWINISSEYAVIIINNTNEALKTGNWVSSKNQNIYKELEDMGGMCYFLTTDGWVKNMNYKNTPALRFEDPIQKPSNLNYLNG